MPVRQKILTDVQIQGILVGRIVIYWLATILYFGMGIAVSQYCDQPDWTLAEHWRAWLAVAGPWIPSTCLLLPLVIYDTIRTSHAFTGPIIRVRQQLTKLAQTPNCTPLVLRQDDYLQDFIGLVNTVQNQILSLHMAIQNQRDTIEQLRSGTNADGLNADGNSSRQSNGSNDPEETSKLQAHRIAQVEEADAQNADSEESQANQEPIGAAS